jgi:hypothetical protein
MIEQIQTVRKQNRGHCRQTAPCRVPDLLLRNLQDLIGYVTVHGSID